MDDLMNEIFEGALTGKLKAILKRILDRTSFGKFDFMYLRMGECLSMMLEPRQNADFRDIDFSNGCK